MAEDERRQEGKRKRGTPRVSVSGSDLRKIHGGHAAACPLRWKSRRVSTPRIRPNRSSGRETKDARIASRLPQARLESSAPAAIKRIIAHTTNRAVMIQYSVPKRPRRTAFI